MKKIFFVIAAIILGAGVWVSRGKDPAVKQSSINAVPEPTQVSSPGKTQAPSKNTTGIPLVLPDGFIIGTFAKGLGNPRVLVWDSMGTLIVSVPGQGKVVALPDANRDGAADATVTVASNLNRPHGLAFHSGKLYVAETDGVSVFDYDSQSRTATNKKRIVSLPSGGNHFTRTIGIGPDNKLYITIGSSCNVCVEKDEKRASMQVANLDGTGLRTYASGLRNTVFFVWDEAGKLWGTDMGRDLIGDDRPPEEVNIIEDGKNYGWPYCFAERVHDNSFDKSKAKEEFCKTTQPPHIMFQAHSAPLGLAFIPPNWPSEYAGDLLVSYHGSWNRNTPTGYKVARFDLDSQKKSTQEYDFISGWLANGSIAQDAFGRPVGLLFDAKGTLFISDDKTGAIYTVAPIH